MEDRKIVEGLLRRDDSALGELERKYGPRLLGLAGRFLKSREDAEEAVNDAWLRVWNTIPPQKPDHLFAYVAQLCRYASLEKVDWLMAGKRSAPVVELTEELCQCLPDPGSEREWEARALGEAINGFLEGQDKEKRVIFLRRYWYGDPIRDIAARCGVGESKVKTTLTVGGAEVSISQLLDMQETGRGLSESFGGMTSGSLTAHNIEAFAEMGIAKSLGNYYGSDKGAIGQMFSQSMDRLYEKGLDQVERGHAWAQTVTYGARTSGNRDAVKTELGLAKLFSQMDTRNKSGLVQSFSSTLAQARSRVAQYCSQYNLPTTHVGLAGATVGIEKFFQTWMEKL